MTKQYKSPVMASIHETAENLHAAGVMDKRTMRKFDEACLTPVHPLSPAEIKSLREREGASQAVFARYLNVSTKLVQAWEANGRTPEGPALVLLHIAARQPQLIERVRQDAASDRPRPSRHRRDRLQAAG